MFLIEKMLPKRSYILSNPVYS